MICKKGFVQFFKILVSKDIFDEFAKARIHFVFGFMGYIPASQFL
jgi:hypothetical protein